MTDTKTILESNPHLFCEGIIQAVQEGFYVTNTNAGYILEGVLKEIVLTQEPDRAFDQIPLGEISLSEHDAQVFLNKLCHAVAVGAVFDTESLVWDITGRKQISGKIYKLPEYTKEQLSDLSWEDFKLSVKTLGITGRDRSLMTTKYLQMTGQSQWT